MTSEGETEEVLRHQPMDLLEFALQQLCQSYRDLDVYLASLASGRSALGPISEAGPACGPRCMAVSYGMVAEEFPFCFLWSWQWRNQVPGGLRHDESACPGSKLANLHPVEKYKHILSHKLAV